MRPYAPRTSALGQDTPGPWAPRLLTTRTLGAAPASPLAGLRTAALAAVVVAALALPAPARAQDEPPPRETTEELSFPGMDERALSNGAELVVVPRHEQPFVAVLLVIRAGSAMDPPDRAGLAEMVSRLLTRGTGGRTAGEIAEEVAAMGASLGASVSADWTTVSLGVPSADLERGLALLADVAMDPAFPQEEMETLRSRALAALRLQLGQAGALASRAFTREVYGDHPYGKLPTPETVGRLRREDAVAFHRRHYHPANALFVVAGAVEPDSVAAVLEERFRGWAPGTPTDPVDGVPPGRTGRDVVLVHRPGSARSVVHIGHPLMEGDSEDWTPVTVATRILGGGSSGRLHRILHEEEGWANGAYAGTRRERDDGAFVVSMEVRSEVTDSAVAEALAQVERLRSEPIPAAELRATTERLVGAFPLDVESPEEVAAQVARSRLLGLPVERLTTYRTRVAALEPEEVRAAAARHLQSARAVVVVVGDAGAVIEGLRPLGAVRVVDEEGNPLDVAGLGAGRAGVAGVARGADGAGGAGGAGRAAGVGVREVALDASTLEPATWTYDVVFRGEALGRVTRTLDPGEEEGTLVLRTELVAPGSRTAESIVFRTAGFVPVRGSQRVQAMGEDVGGELTYAEGRVTGRVRTSRGEREVDVGAPPSFVLGGMAEIAPWIADLSEGMSFTLPQVSVEEGRLVEVTYRVVGATEVTVPSGTFDAWEVEIAGPQGAQTLFLRREAPHVTLKVQVAAQPISLELTSMP